MQGHMAEGSFRLADHTLAAYFSVLGGCFENLKSSFIALILCLPPLLPFQLSCNPEQMSLFGL